MKLWKSNFFYLGKVQNIQMLGSEISEKNSKKQWRLAQHDNMKEHDILPMINPKINNAMLEKFR